MLTRFSSRSNAAQKPEQIPLPVVENDIKPSSPDIVSRIPAKADLLGEHANRLIAAKVDIHRRLIEVLNVSLLDRVPRETLRDQVSSIILDEVRDRNLALNRSETSDFVDEIIDEMVGLGPLETLLKDDSIADILVNTYAQVYVERFGKLELTEVRFKDNDHLLRIVNKIVTAVGRRVDEMSPLCDARLQDGSRINVAVPPAAVDGPVVSIRKFKKSKLSLDSLIEYNALRPVMAEVLREAVRGRVTILISGGTGTGKTTALNALSSAIPNDERLITVEDAAELQLQQPHVIRLETRPPNLEGKGEIRQRELVKNCLRMRPDRIILGEVRGEEAFDMLQAMNTGHEGSLATIHSNTPRDALMRLESMVAMAGMVGSEASVRSQIANAVGLIVQLERQSDGSRKFISITEITGMEGDVIQTQELFKFIKTGLGTEGQVLGEFRATGIRPKFATGLASRGVMFPASHFDPRVSL